MYSTVRTLSNVRFPEFTGERQYMRAFNPQLGLPSDLKRWSRCVESMLTGLDLADGHLAYLTIDQAHLTSGQIHRRPGVHIDGDWVESTPLDENWDTDKWKTWPDKVSPVGYHETKRGHQIKGAGHQTILLASDVLGCRAFMGEYSGECGEGGDYSHLDTSSLTPIYLRPYTVYAGHSMTMLHESIPVPYTCSRTLVRLNVVEKDWN